MRRWEIVTSGGRGVHLWHPDSDHAICQREVLQHTGRMVDEKALARLVLCGGCGRAVASLLSADGRGR